MHSKISMNVIISGGLDNKRFGLARVYPYLHSTTISITTRSPLAYKYRRKKNLDLPIKQKKKEGTSSVS